MYLYNRYATETFVIIPRVMLLFPNPKQNERLFCHQFENEFLDNNTNVRILYMQWLKYV